MTRFVVDGRYNNINRSAYNDRVLPGFAVVLVGNNEAGNDSYAGGIKELRIWSEMRTE